MQSPRVILSTKIISRSLAPWSDSYVFAQATIAVTSASIIRNATSGYAEAAVSAAITISA